MIYKSSQKVITKLLKQSGVSSFEKYRSLLFFVLIMFVVAGTAPAKDKASAPPQAETLGTPQRSGLQPCETPMSQHERASLDGIINEREAHYTAGNRHWSRLYHWTLYGSIFFSALAALIIKLSFREGSRIKLHQKRFGSCFRLHFRGAPWYQCGRAIQQKMVD